MKTEMAQVVLFYIYRGAVAAPQTGLTSCQTGGIGSGQSLAIVDRAMEVVHVNVGEQMRA